MIALRAAAWQKRVPVARPVPRQFSPLMDTEEIGAIVFMVVFVAILIITILGGIARTVPSWWCTTWES